VAARGRVVLVPATLTAITVMAAALRVWGLRFGLPDVMARPDEEAITTIAARFVLIGPNPNFFDYPTLFMHVVASIERHWPGGQAVFDDTLPRLISRSLSAALGTATIPLVYAIGRRLFSTRAALLAAAFLAIAFLHVRDSHFGVTDVPMTFMVTLAFLVIVWLPQDRAPLWLVVIAAALCGLATSTKYNAALIVVPLFIAVWQRKGSHWAYPVIVGCFAAGFLAGTPYAWIARQKFFADVVGLQSHLSGGHATDEGLGWIRHLTFSLRYGLGVPLLLAALGGLAWLAAIDRRTAMIVLAFPVLYYLGMGSGRTVFMRHMTPVVPFAALLAAFALDRAATLLDARLMPRDPYPANGARGFSRASLVVALLAIAIGFDSTRRSIALDRLLSEEDSRAVAAAALKQRYFPRGASVFQNGSIYGQVPLVPEGIYHVMPLDRLPQLVIIQSSPLTAYSDQPPDWRQKIAGQYTEILRVPVERSSPTGPEPVFDQQDAFFVPVVGFERFVRPGPAIEVFERTGNP
jgi:4-amino-4-deoxy-L-arabinose transferase-like glycosyltransferase